jgi:hypothetical protein
VTVVSGYVKCPRCHAVLPGAGRYRRPASAGGTAVEERGFPIVPVGIAALAIAVVLVLVLGGGDKKKKDAPAALPEGEPTEPVADPTTAPAGPTNAAPPATSGPRTPDIPSAPGPDPRAAAGELERALGRQRLWSSVQASGSRVEIRSGACADPAMGPAIDAARATLRGAGLTRLRCLAQSGAVVFERDL